MNKAQRKTEFSEFFIFSSFGIVRLKKFGEKFGSINPVLGAKTGFSEYSESTEYSDGL